MDLQKNPRRGFAYLQFSVSALMVLLAVTAIAYMSLGIFSQMSFRFVILFLALIGVSNLIARLAYLHIEE